MTDTWLGGMLPLRHVSRAGYGVVPQTRYVCVDRPVSSFPSPIYRYVDTPRAHGPIGYVERIRLTMRLLICILVGTG
jgi:hypothetical protein